MDSAQNGLDRIRRWAAAGTFIATLLVYWLTLHPGVAGDDAGEFIAVAAGMGVAHPPGYPLYTLLGKLFTYIPMGSVAWRVNLLSATCGALAASVLVLAVSRWTRSVGAGLLSAALFAFSPIAWSYAVTSDVFALNNLLLAAMLWLAARHAERRDVAGIVAFAAVAGLGVSNHHTSVLLAGPLGAWMIWTARGALASGGAGAAARRVLAVLGAGLAGLLPYLHLPLAAARVPRVSWGETDTLPGFVTHLLRREYGTLSLSSDATSKGDFLGGIANYASSLPRQLTYVGLLLAAVGLVAGLRRRDWTGNLTAPILAAFLLYVGIFEGLANLPKDDPLYLGIHEAYWQHPNLLLAALAGLGFSALSEWRWRLQAAAWTGIAVAAAVGLAGLNWRASDRSGERTVDAYGRSFLASLPPGAILLGRGDLQTNPLRYLQECEGARPDVRILDRSLLAKPWFHRIARRHFPELVFPGRVLGAGVVGGYGLGELIAANYGRAPILVAAMGKDERDLSWQASWTPWPFGYANLVLPAGSVPELGSYVADHERALAGTSFPAAESYPDGSWERLALEHYWYSRYIMGERLMQLAAGEKGAARKQALDLAATSLARLVRDQPSAPFWVFKNLGLAYQELGMRPEMRDALERYLRVAPKDDADYESIRRYVGAR